MSPLSRPGRALALDPGERRVGVAISDSTRSIAMPRDAIDRRVVEDLALAVTRLVEEEGVTEVVVGLPRHLDGREGPSASSARQLAQQLAASLGPLGVGVELHDERLTTVEAASALRAAGVSAKRQRDQVDSAAATVLLEDWLRRR